MEPISGYKAMWQFAMFDLPVDTKEARRDYVRFRKLLLSNGFCMLQHSVYARFCRSEESSETIRRRIRANLPPDGEVRLVSVTDRQFGKMEIYRGEKRTQPEEPPAQIQLF